VVVPGVAGDTYQPPAPFHTETHRYCYPDTGIEMPLGVMPVTECNRWEPVAPDEGRRKRERAYWQSRDGNIHACNVADWDERQREAQREGEEAERLILDAQVEAELGLCTFAYAPAAGGVEATCLEFPQYSRIAETSEAALELVYGHVRGRIRHLILNNQPLPEHQGDR